MAAEVGIGGPKWDCTRMELPSSNGEFLILFVFFFNCGAQSSATRCNCSAGCYSRWWPPKFVRRREYLDFPRLCCHYVARLHGQEVPTILPSPSLFASTITRSFRPPLGRGSEISVHLISLAVASMKRMSLHKTSSSAEGERTYSRSSLPPDTSAVD